MTSSRSVLLGVVSDTHGYLDPRLVERMKGVDAILHAGDVGSEEVLAGLRRIAPLHAVCGNNDAVLGNLGLPAQIDVDVGGVLVHVTHQLAHAVAGPDVRVVVFGHSHLQLSEWREGRLYLNPGAAGRRGFHRLQTAALLHIYEGEVVPELITLGPRVAAARR